MKKIFLGILLCVFMTGAPMCAHADTPVAYNVILKVLQLQEFRDQLDTDAILAKMYDNEDRSLAYIASVCKGTLFNRADISPCEDLLTRMIKEQKKYIDFVNSELRNYISNGIKPDKNKILARTSDGKYYAAEILIPDTIDLSTIPEDVLQRFKKTPVAFKKNDTFFCAFVHNRPCYKSQSYLLGDLHYLVLSGNENTTYTLQVITNNTMEFYETAIHEGLAQMDLLLYDIAYNNGVWF